MPSRSRNIIEEEARKPLPKSSRAFADVSIGRRRASAGAQRLMPRRVGLPSLRPLWQAEPATLESWQKACKVAAFDGKMKHDFAERLRETSFARGRRVDHAMQILGRETGEIFSPPRDQRWALLATGRREAKPSGA